jgi:GNAT superfamily N-acetyltransferase
VELQTRRGPCQHCGTIGEWHPAPRIKTWRGRMYIGQRLVDGPLICGECDARSLVQSLRLGWDVHNHPIDFACNPQCATQRGGRAMQRALMRQAVFDRRNGFLLVKAIDGAPRVNGTLPIQVMRAFRFLLRERQTWYEPVRSVQQLVETLRLRMTLEDAGVPLRACPNPMLVLQLYESAYHAPSGAIQPPKAGERPLALHAVMPERLRSDGASIEFWNSWGQQWGRNGYGAVDIGYLDTHFHEAWCGWDARWGGSHWKEDFREIGDPGKLRRVWMLENPLFSTKMPGTRRGDSWYVENFPAFTPFDESYIEVIQVRNGYGLRMGWAFLGHLQSEKISWLRELFVMPALRGQGVGSVLEGIFCQRAREMGSREARAIIHEADGGVLTNRRTARPFLVHRNYRLRWKTQTGPRAIALATKELPPA